MSGGAHDAGRADGTACDLLLTNVGQLVTPIGACGDGALRGRDHGALHVTRRAAVAVRDGRIAWVGPADAWHGEARTTRDVHGAAVVPGLVDPHTHAVWAGDRLDDFEARARGEGYEQLLARGGGIRHTMRCTAAADHATLVEGAARRLAVLHLTGATTIEVKSGYGFDPDAELRMLRAIRAAARHTPAQIVPTLLLHVPPADVAERDAYVAHACDALIPTVARERLAEAVDVFVEREAFTVAEADRLLAAARAHGLATKLHADQFHAIGGVACAVRHDALSVDHCEASGAEEVAALAASATIATLLPGVTLHLGLPAAPGRALIDAGAAVAVGSDLNPGSSPLFHAPLPMALAVRLNRLTPAEALVAATCNAAAALGRRDRGRLAPGCRADLLVLDADDWRELPYALGRGVARHVVVGGADALFDAGWA